LPVYLYYISTEDPEINISRVKNRGHLKGHDVPENKIKDRYYRSLGLLMDAIKKRNRAYIFDNSTDGKEKVWFAEITDGQTVEFKNDLVPLWFKAAVLNKIDS
jgi:predicted ABC-type ATPase